MWVRAIFVKRQQQGEYGNLLQEMRMSDPQCHFQYVRMSKEKFDILLSLVGPLLTKRHYFSRQRVEITPAERLAVTLRYLATGNSQVSLSFNFRIGRSTICGIVRETSQAIWDAMKTLYTFVHHQTNRNERALATNSKVNGTSPIVLVQSMVSTSLCRHLPILGPVSLIRKEHTRLS